MARQPLKILNAFNFSQLGVQRILASRWLCRPPARATKMWDGLVSLSICAENCGAHSSRLFRFPDLLSAVQEAASEKRNGKVPRFARSRSFHASLLLRRSQEGASTIRLQPGDHRPSPVDAKSPQAETVRIDCRRCGETTFLARGAK